jgi:sec-independent protein translocase protein TatA
MGLDNPIHILFLLILLLLVFGAKRLPEMGRSLGSGLRGFKDSLNGAGAHGADMAQAAQPVSAAQPVPVQVHVPSAPVAAAPTVNQEQPDVPGGRE